MVDDFKYSHLIGQVVEGLKAISLEESEEEGVKIKNSVHMIDICRIITSLSRDSKHRKVSMNSTLLRSLVEIFF